MESDDPIPIASFSDVASVWRVGVGEHANVVSQSVAIVTGPGQRAVEDGIGSGLLRLWLPPSAVDRVGDGWSGECIGSVGGCVDAVFDDDTQVLISANVRCPGAADGGECRVTTCLRPAVAIEIGEQSVAGSSVQVHGSAERGLREHAFHSRVGPVLAPGVQELQLSVAEQFQALEIDGRSVVVRVVDMVGSRPHFGDLALGAALELPVFEDGKIDAADSQAGVVDSDLAEHGCGIERIGQVPGLAALDHVHVASGVEVATAGSGRRGGLFTVFAPDVALSNVVVVGDGDHRSVAEDVSELDAPFEPAEGVLGVVVRLVSGKEQQVGVLAFEVVDDAGSRTGAAARVARECSDDDHVLVGGVATHQSVEGRSRPKADAVADVLAVVPVLDPKVSTPAQLVDLGTSRFCPGLARLKLQPNHPGLIRQQREQLGGQFQDALVMCVDGKGEHLIARHHQARFHLAFGFPPFAGRVGIEARERGAKGLFLDRQTRLAKQRDQQEQLQQRERAIHRAVPDWIGESSVPSRSKVINQVGSSRPRPSELGQEFHTGSRRGASRLAVGDERVDDEDQVLSDRLLVADACGQGCLSAVVGIGSAGQFDDDLLSELIEEDLVADATTDGVAGRVGQGCSVAAQSGGREQQSGLTERSAGQWSTSGGRELAIGPESVDVDQVVGVVRGPGDLAEDEFASAGRRGFSVGRVRRQEVEPGVVGVVESVESLSGTESANQQATRRVVGVEIDGVEVDGT